MTGPNESRTSDHGTPHLAEQAGQGTSARDGLTAPATTGKVVGIEEGAEENVGRSADGLDPRDGGPDVEVLTADPVRGE